MQFIKAGFEILDDIDGVEILKKIERISRVCYKSESKITDDSCYGMVKGLIARKHFAMLEHVSVTAKFITDRGISHELVRHRLASFAQESTRYVSYSGNGRETQIIMPGYLRGNETDSFDEAVIKMTARKIVEALADRAEEAYFGLRDMGFTPEQARGCLLTFTKTEIVVTANLREWRHIFDLRAAGSTGKVHPQMLEIVIPALEEFKRRIPVVFDDIMPGV